MTSHDLIFHGPRRKYYYNWVYEGEQGTEPQHAQADLKLHMEESYNSSTNTSSLTFTVFIQFIEANVASGSAVWVDGDIIWRPAPTTEVPDPSWQVVGTFSAYAGTASVSYQVDGAFHAVTRSGSPWAVTVSGINVSDIQVGIRRRSTGLYPFNNFGVYTGPMNNWNDYRYPYCFPEGNSDSSSYLTVIAYQDLHLEVSGGSAISIDTGNGWVQAIPYVDTGNGWVQAIPYVDTGTGWVQCG